MKEKINELGCFFLVLGFFDGDEEKTRLWFNSKNPHLGGTTPNFLIENGRGDKVEQLIEALLNENV